MNKKILLIVGKSGSGKDYLCNLFQLKMAVSHTTRLPRKGEKNGVDKHFHSLTSFDEEEFNSNKKIVAKTKRGEDYYWITEEDLLMSEAFIVDVKGVETMYNHYGKDNFYKFFKIIYFDVGKDTRVKNMKLRGDSEEEINNRLAIDEVEFQNIVNFEHSTIYMV